MHFPASYLLLQLYAYKLFGINEFAARIGSALFGLGTVASLWILGRFSNFSRDKNELIQLANNRIQRTLYISLDDEIELLCLACLDTAEQIFQ